eukprot:gene15205-16775_t
MSDKKTFGSYVHAHPQRVKSIASRRVDSQKVVTFYRDKNRIQPELRMVINSKKDNFEILLQELTTALHLQEDERQIFNVDGRHILRVDDFQDGECYFFSDAPAVIDESIAVSLLQEDSENKKVNTNERVMKIITNGSSDVWKVCVDENKLASFSQLLHELNGITSTEKWPNFLSLLEQGKKDSELHKNVITTGGETHVFYPPSNKFHQNLRPSIKPPEQKSYNWNGSMVTMARNPLGMFMSSNLKNFMALHPNKWFVATGQAAPNSRNISVVDHIRIWNSDYLNTLAILRLDEQTLSISCLAFSIEDNGHKLASVDADGSNCRLLVWNWNERKILARSQSYDVKENCLKFHPHSNKTLMSAGDGHVFYWTWRQQFLEKYNGHFFGCEKPTTVNSLVFLSNGDAVTADDNGHIHFWKNGGRRTTKAIKIAYKGDIKSLLVLSHDMLLTYSTDDKLLSLWDTREQRNGPSASVEISGDHGDVTSIAVSPDHHHEGFGNMEIYLGTNRNRILQGTFKTHFAQIVKGHAIETTAMTSNPRDNHIVTSGLDGYVIYRSAESHSIIWETKLEEAATALGFYPYGNVFAVGTTSGRWSVLKSKDGSHVASFQSGRHAVSCISYSTDGSEVAIGTESGEIYLFSVYDQGLSYRMAATIQSSADEIKALDWSKEGMYIRAMTHNLHQSIWNVEKLAETRDLKTIADINWQMQKSTLSYNTAGVWKPGSDLRILCCDWLATRDLLCVGTELGHIRLFSYPSQSIESEYREYSLHVSDVNNVSFLPSQSHLVSSGQHNNTVIQWRIAFGNIYEQGIKSGIFPRSAKINDNDINNIIGERVSSSRGTTPKLGHRRVRSVEPRRMTFDVNPFQGSGSVSPRKSSIKCWDGDYPSRQVKLQPFEIRKHLQKTGACEHIVALRKSKGFLQDYNVVGPITKERQKKTSKEGKSFPKI